MKNEKWLYLLIIISVLLRLLLSAHLELGNDEVYYTIYAKQLQPGYFDHPPLVGYLISLTSLGSTLHSEFAIRLGAIACSLFNLWLIYEIVLLWSSRKGALIALGLAAASPYLSLIAGTMIMPDSAMQTFWIAALYAALRIVSEKNPEKYFLLFGIMVGLASLSKIHGIMLWAALGLYILFFNIRQLKNPFLYLGFLATLIIVSPYIIWNADNDFISFTFHQNRVNHFSSLQIDSFIRELLGGFLYNNPISYILITIVVFRELRSNRSEQSPQQKFLLIAGGLPIVLFLSLSLFNDTLPHWSAPGFTCLIVYVGICLGKHEVGYFSEQRTGNWLKMALSLLCVAMVGLYSFISYYPGTTSGNKKIEMLGDGDPSLDLYGWKQASEKLRVFVNDSLHQKSITLVCSKWFPAAHVYHYIAEPNRFAMLTYGELQELHTFRWFAPTNGAIPKDQPIYFITFSNMFQAPSTAVLNAFDITSTPVYIPILRNGVVAKYMVLYEMREK